MAIVIEEEKRKINWFVLLLVIVLVGIIAAAIYYLFFSPVPLIEKVIPQKVQSIQEISATEFRPDVIINNQTFKILKQYVNPIELPSSTSGRANPFTLFR